MTPHRARKNDEMTAFRHYLWAGGIDPEMIARKPRRPRSDGPDLHTQLESLLDEVWRCESTWRFDDRIALAVKVDKAGGHKASGRNDH
jgi:hypothetical protein